MLPSWHAVHMMLVRTSCSDTPRRLASSSSSASPSASSASQLDAASPRRPCCHVFHSCDDAALLCCIDRIPTGTLSLTGWVGQRHVIKDLSMACTQTTVPPGRLSPCVRSHCRPRRKCSGMVMASNKYAELLKVAKKAAQAAAQVMHTPSAQCTG